jgi:hypothetical protein
MNPYSRERHFLALYPILMGLVGLGLLAAIAYELLLPVVRAIP